MTGWGLPEGVIPQAGRTQGGFQIEAWQDLSWAPGRAVWQQKCYHLHTSPALLWAHHMCLSYLCTFKRTAGWSPNGWEQLGVALPGAGEQQEVPT